MAYHTAGNEKVLENRSVFLKYIMRFCVTTWDVINRKILNESQEMKFNVTFSVLTITIFFFFLLFRSALIRNWSVILLVGMVLVLINSFYT